MNYTNLKSNDIFASIAAGCTDYDDIFTVEEISQIENEVAKVDKTKSGKVGKQSSFPNLIIYFDNDSITVDETYEDTGFEWANTHNPDEYGLNRPWTEPDKIDELKKDLNTDYSSFIMNLTGEASIDGIPVIKNQSKKDYNQKLSEDRSEAVRKWILKFLDDKTDKNFGKRIKTPNNVGEGRAKNTNDVSVSPTDSLGKKKDRKVTIEFKYDSTLDEQVVNATEIPVETPKDNKDRKSVV